MLPDANEDMDVSYVPELHICGIYMGSETFSLLACRNIHPKNPTLWFLQERYGMNRKLDSTIWKRSKVDRKGRTVLPIKLRKKLGLNGKCSILWICANRKDSKDKEFLIEIGVKNE